MSYRFQIKGIELEGDQRLVEGIIHGMGVKDASPVTSPGTKSKPITKEAHKEMMSRRIVSKEEDSIEIKKQQDEIERLNKRISELCSKLRMDNDIDTTSGRMSIDLWPSEGVGATGVVHIFQTRAQTKLQMI